MSDYITIAQIAEHLRVNRWTIYRWIDWYYSDFPKPDGIYLPDFHRQGVSKLYHKDDLKYFESFQRCVPRGAMAGYNKYKFWKKNEATPDYVKAATHASAEKQRAIKYPTEK